MSKYTPEQRILVFWSRVDKSAGQSACWPWTGSRVHTKYGDTYGTVQWIGKLEIASRIAWVLTNGAIPQEMCVLHKCDNPPCCNPEHLFLGSRIDNNRDRNLKNRQAKLGGELHGNRKLSARQISEIRSRYAEDRITMSQLAVEFDVSIAHISRIIHRQSWK